MCFQEWFFSKLELLFIKLDLKNILIANDGKFN